MDSVPKVGQSIFHKPNTPFYSSRQFFCIQPNTISAEITKTIGI